MAKGDGNILERNLFSACVETDSHGGTSAERDQEIVIRPRAFIMPAVAHRLLTAQSMATAHNFLPKPAGFSVLDHIGRFRVGFRLGGGNDCLHAERLRGQVLSRKREL